MEDHGSADAWFGTMIVLSLLLIVGGIFAAIKSQQPVAVGGTIKTIKKPPFNKSFNVSFKAAENLRAEEARAAEAAFREPDPEVENNHVIYMSTYQGSDPTDGLYEMVVLSGEASVGRGVSKVKGNSEGSWLSDMSVSVPVSAQFPLDVYIINKGKRVAHYQITQ